jgi:hypothetical protein
VVFVAQFGTKASLRTFAKRLLDARCLQPRLRDRSFIYEARSHSFYHLPNIIWQTGYSSVVSAADSGNMSYSDFKTIDQAVSTLELTVEDIPHFFSQVAPIEPSQRLKESTG